jgi:serine/threonine protein kinase
LERESVSMKSRQVISKADVTHLIEFMVACIVVGLEYMHNNGVIHRDIKPENLVMENNGYVRITDLGIARIWSPENSQDTSGTPGYMGK